MKSVTIRGSAAEIRDMVLAALAVVTKGSGQKEVIVQLVFGSETASSYVKQTVYDRQIKGSSNPEAVKKLHDVLVKIARCAGVERPTQDAMSELFHIDQGYTCKLLGGKRRFGPGAYWKIAEAVRDRVPVELLEELKALVIDREF